MYNRNQLLPFKGKEEILNIIILLLYVSAEIFSIVNYNYRTNMKIFAFGI